ncbi:MAG: Ig domain-containing protein [Acidobacteriota bacterium]
MAQLGAMDLRLINPTLPVARVGSPYQPGPLLIESSGRCPDGNIGIRLVDGGLPAGLSLNGGGYLQGTPRQPGRYGFTVELRNACSRALEQLVLEVGVTPMLWVSTPTLTFSCERGGRPPEPQRVMVYGNQPGLAYQMSAAGAPWLEVRPRRGMLPPPGSALESDAVDLFVHPEKLDSGDYHTTLFTHAFGATAAASTTVHLTVKPAGTGWDGVRTMPMLEPPASPASIPIVIVPPAVLQPPQPPAPKPTRRKPVAAAKPPQPKPIPVPITRSRIVPVPKVTLPEASKGPSKLLGDPEILEPGKPMPSQKKPPAEH